MDSNAVSSPVASSSDIIPPVVAILSPNASIYTNSTTLNISFTANDTNLDTTNISVYDASSALVNSTLNSSASASVLLTVPSDGTYSIVATSHDLSGNSGSANVTGIIVDTTVPVVVISSPANNSVQYSRTLSIDVTVTEANLDSSLSNLAVTDSTGSVVNYATLNGTGTYLLTVPADGTYNITALAVDKAGLSNSSTSSNVTAVSLTNSTNGIQVDIPTGTNISGNSSWDGIVHGPSIELSANVTPHTQGFLTNVSKVFEIGAKGIELTFDRAAKIVVPGETGKMAGYSYDGITFNKITTVCADNTQATNDLLAAGGSCYFDDGKDLTIWTKHFTQFVTYAQMPFNAVNLGTAGNFVVLAKTGISTTGTTSIVGNIGVSPAAASYITGFGLIMDSSNQFSASSLVNGNVYASDYAAPTPTVMTTAIGDMQTAYTDAAGRTLPDYTELGAGEIGGKTLAPGLYKWGTGVTISTDVTLDCQGNSSAVYIFQIAQTLDISNGKQVILSGGCNASNIFW